MFDVFYTNQKPNLFQFEQPAKDLADAAQQSRTEFFWLIDGLNDYDGFNFEWQPAPWESHHVHVFPSQHQPDGSVYFARKDTATNYEWHFRTEQRVIRRGSYLNWVIPSNIDIDKFDFSWHPNKHEPDYEYHFGTQWQQTGGPIWPGTSGVALIDTQRAVATQAKTNWTIPDNIEDTALDFSWHPDTLSPAFIYHFPSEWQKSSGLMYTVPGATEVKILGETPSLSAHVSKAYDIFFIDKHNKAATERFEKLKAKYNVCVM
jgi:hypothetical protein